MTDRLIVAFVCVWLGWNGLFPDPPTPQSLREKTIESQHAKVCSKTKLRAKIKAKCKEWGYYD